MKLEVPIHFINIMKIMEVMRTLIHQIFNHLIIIHLYQILNGMMSFFYNSKNRICCCFFCRDIVGNNLQFNSSSQKNGWADDENNQLAALLLYRDALKKTLTTPAKFSNGFPR